MIQIFSKKIDPLPLVRGNGPMVQSPYAPPLIPEATNRKTDGMAGVVPGNTAVEVVQGTVPSIGPGKRRRPPVPVEANVVEDPVGVP